MRFCLTSIPDLFIQDSIKKQNADADADGRGLSLGGAIFVQLSLSDTFESISMGWFRAGCRVARVPIRKTLSQGGSYLTGRQAMPSRNPTFHSTIFRATANTALVPPLVPLSRLTCNFLEGTSSVYIEELQKARDADLDSVGESWDNFFRNFVGQTATSTGVTGQTIQESMRLLLLIKAY